MAYLTETILTLQAKFFFYFQNLSYGRARGYFGVGILQFDVKEFSLWTTLYIFLRKQVLQLKAIQWISGQSELERKFSILCFASLCAEPLNCSLGYNDFWTAVTSSSKTTYWLRFQTSFWWLFSMGHAWLIAWPGSYAHVNRPSGVF